jgi:hypothetical protein
VPEASRDNRPDMLAARFARWREIGLFAPLPFGTDFTNEELTLVKSLKNLSTLTASWPGRLRIAAAMLGSPQAPEFRPFLERMSLTTPASIRERIERRLVTAALRLGAG